MTTGIAIDAAARAFDLMKAIPRDKHGNPLTCEGVIRSILLKNPNFGYRDHALEVMYCLLGSGVDWNSAGRLADSSPNNYMNMPPQAGGQGIWSCSFGRTDSFETMKLPQEIQDEITRKSDAELADAIQTVVLIDERCQSYDPKTESNWYPISWYGCNLCAPFNAQDDFLSGAIETATLIVNATPERCTKHWLDHQRTKTYATDVLAALCSRSN